MPKTEISSETFLVSRYQWPKRKFDSSNMEDLKEYDFFLKQNKWRVNCPFELEWPFLSIPEMIQNKLISQYLDMMLTKANEKS